MLGSRCARGKESLDLCDIFQGYTPEAYESKFADSIFPYTYIKKTEGSIKFDNSAR